MIIDWSKAPEGAEGAMVAQFGNSIIAKGVVEFIPREGWDRSRYVEGPDDWLYFEKPTVWSCKGLPPVGTVCEFNGGTYAPEDTFDKDLLVGDQVTIIAHIKDGDLELAVFTFNPQIRNHNRGSVSVEQGAYGCFRPIRTPEQIAAEEHAKAIRDLIERTDYILDETAAAAVLAAGYRKPE